MDDKEPFWHDIIELKYLVTCSAVKYYNFEWIKTPKFETSEFGP